MNGADAVASILKQEGVEYLFCYPSNPLIEACAKIGIRPVLARTERTVVNMADGYARTSNRRKLAVCAVQHSPGSENSFGGIAQAYADSVPILFLPGGVEREEAIIAPNFDATFNYKNVTKWANRIPTPERIPAMMRRAISQVRNGRPGPVLLEVPIDISQGDFDPSDLSYQPIVTTRLAPDPDVVEDAARAILSAENVLISAGQGVMYAEATDELRQLAELIQAPVASTMPGKGAFPDDHPLSCGGAGRSYSDMADHFRHKADLVLGVGCSFTLAPYAMPFPPGKVMVHITLNEGDINKEYPTEYPLIADAKLALQAIIDEINLQTDGEPIDRNGDVADELKGIKESWMAKWLPALTSDEKPINPYRVIWDTMHAVDRRQTIATHEAGYPRDQMVPFWQSLEPNTYLGWGKTTQLGTSMGLAMGAKLAAPDKQVIALQGDAAIGMCGMEIETAVRERIPVTIIVLNNSIMTGYNKYLPVAMEEYGIGKLSGDYAKLAESLGAYSERVEEPGEIKAAIRRAAEQNNAGRAALIECMVAQYAHVSPE